ncbi:MAG: flagellar basal-body MS-ring/collar protein FliF [Limisphaerales bacterium]
MNQKLSKLGTQLLQIWGQLGVSQRVSVALATLLVVAGLSSIGYWSGGGNYVLLYGRLSEAEAAKVVASLDEAKIPYKLGGGGGSILVPAEKVHATRMQMALKGIPSGDGVGFEIFDKPNFGISDLVQRANLVRAIQGELARTISQLDDVESARVMIVMPENRLLVERDKHPTASVFVRVRGNVQLAASAVNAIRFLVANSVEGLKPNQVSVMDNQANLLAKNGEEDSLEGNSAGHLTARKNLEGYLAKKIEDMLEPHVGPGNAMVRVAADINLDTITRIEEKFDPEARVIRTETKDEENTDTTTASQNEVAGISANTVTETNSTAAAAGPLNSTRMKKTTGTTEYEVSRSTSNIAQAAGGIKRLTAAVTVASRFEGLGEARKVVNRTPEELEKLRRIVQSALGSDTERGDQVTLEELPFNNDLATQLTEQLDQQGKREFWWELARTAVYPVLALGVLGLFFRLLKRTSADGIPIGIPVGNLAAHGHGNGNGRGNWRGNGHDHPDLSNPDRRRQPGGNALTIEALQQLIKENPTAMSQAIKHWLARGNAKPDRD